MNDIVIFFKSLEKYLKHLYNIFYELTIMKIILQHTNGYPKVYTSVTWPSYCKNTCTTALNASYK